VKNKKSKDNGWWSPEDTVNRQGAVGSRRDRNLEKQANTRLIFVPPPAPLTSNTTSSLFIYRVTSIDQILKKEVKFPVVGCEDTKENLYPKYSEDVTNRYSIIWRKKVCDFLTLFDTEYLVSSKHCTEPETIRKIVGYSRIFRLVEIQTGPLLEELLYGFGVEFQQFLTEYTKGISNLLKKQLRVFIIDNPMKFKWKINRMVWYPFPSVNLLLVDSFRITVIGLPITRWKSSERITILRKRKPRRISDEIEYEHLLCSEDVSYIDLMEDTSFVRFAPARKGSDLLCVTRPKLKKPHNIVKLQRAKQSRDRTKRYRFQRIEKLFLQKHNLE